MSLANIVLAAGRAGRGSGGRVANIIEFIEAPWGINLKLFPVQRVILKAHYGIELDDTKTFAISDWRRQKFQHFTEAGYLKHLAKDGRCNIDTVIPGQERRELVLSIGRRSGKTLLAACIAAYETYKLILKEDPQSYYGLARSDTIGILSVATDRDQAGLLYKSVKGHFTSCDFFFPYTANLTQTYATFQTPADIARYGRYEEDSTAKASINVTFKSCIASGVRGSGNLVVILDEIAHFIAEAGQSSAKEVDDALRPSIAAFSPKDPNDWRVPNGPGEGRIISISSPLGRQGHFFELFQLGMKGGAASERMLCVQAPTWEVNPSIEVNQFEVNFAKDPRVFFTEFGAMFTDRTAGWIEQESDLTDCIDKTARPLMTAPSRRPHFIGIDLGLVNDATAVAIGHIEPTGVIVVDLVEDIMAGEGQYARDAQGAVITRLDFDAVADWIHSLSRRFYLVEGLFDQWAGIPFEQALAKKGLRQLKSEHMTQKLNSDMYRNFKDMMWDKRLRLYDWPIPDGKEHCKYIDELLGLQAEYHSKYIMEVAAPKHRHDDLADALIRMVWLASQSLTKPKYMAGVMSAGAAAARAGMLGRESDYRRAVIRSRLGGTSPDRQVSPFGRHRVRAVHGR